MTIFYLARENPSLLSLLFGGEKKLDTKLAVYCEIICFTKTYIKKQRT